MSEKNTSAIFITYFIALTISWFIWGHTTEHIWSAWLFLVMLLTSIVIFILIITSHLKTDTFDSTLLFSVVGIIAHDLFLLSEVSNINIEFLSVLAYIFSGALALLLVFTLVRYLQNQSS